ncbi:uncharacterized protein LOC112603158 isoform X2 [Melanaphis sacchari]|nr:uncharacterized protein LOC112603158 isoform X2 [Melanaphis sacchari]
MKSTLDGKSRWKEKIENKDYTPLTCKNCCELATKLLENFEEKTHLFHRPSTTSTNPERPFDDNKSSTSYYHDDSKCYCSLPTNSDHCLENCTKNVKCCVCNVSD